MSITHGGARGRIFMNHRAAVIVMTMLLLGAGSALGQVPELIIGTASGTPGSTAEVTVGLSNGGIKLLGIGEEPAWGH